MNSEKRLRPEQRLRTQASFKNLVDQGSFARGVFFCVWTGLQKEILREAKAARPMIGIVVSKRTAAKATERNTFKRRIREIFRTNQKHLKSESVCLIKMRALKKRPPFALMEEELVALLKKTGAWA